MTDTATIHPRLAERVIDATLIGLSMAILKAERVNPNPGRIAIRAAILKMNPGTEFTDDQLEGLAARVATRWYETAIEVMAKMGQPKTPDNPYGYDVDTADPEDIKKAQAMLSDMLGQAPIKDQTGAPPELDALINGPFRS